MKDKPDFKAFNEAFKARTGAWPIYPVYHMAQASSALQAAYDKAGKAAAAMAVARAGDRRHAGSHLPGLGPAGDAAAG